MSHDLRSAIVLSVNRALLGEVFAELVAVACVVADERRFELVFCVDCPLSDALADAVSCIETEVVADFPADYAISHRIVASGHAELPPGGFWIFLRKRKP
jgi:hypothetical protein